LSRERGQPGKSGQENLKHGTVQKGKRVRREDEMGDAGSGWGEGEQCWAG